MSGVYRTLPVVCSYPRICLESIEHYLWYVPSLEQVWSLEDLLVWDPVLLGCGQEGLDVLHEEEGRTLLNRQYLERLIVH